MTWVISESMSIFLSMYQSTIFGTSRRPLAPPNAVPIHWRPVTSWNGRVEISWPAPATPMITDLAQRRRIDEMRHAELAAERLARRVEVDAHDHVGADHARALHDIEADAAQAE